VSDIGEAFFKDGFIRVAGAIAPDIVRECVREIGEELKARSVDLEDPTTWTKPVVRIPCPEGPPFAAAGTSPALARTYDELLGPGQWVRREGVGGTVPVRFPSTDDPGDAGWHIDGSYEVDGRYFANVRSRHRGLLALFLFSDVGPDDAPTEVIVGSHLDVPPLLAPFGEGGAAFDTASLPASTFERPRVFATGTAGDVFLCHPFIVHRATWPHRGKRPRILAQPEVAHREPYRLDPRAPACLVEEMILAGLATSAP
jgi:hypothetical protein